MLQLNIPQGNLLKNLTINIYILKWCLVRSTLRKLVCNERASSIRRLVWELPSMANMSLSGKTQILPQIQALTSLSSVRVSLSNNIHSYPFKNTVKLWAYKNNLNIFIQPSQFFFFKFKYKKVFVACKV